MIYWGQLLCLFIVPFHGSTTRTGLLWSLNPCLLNEGKDGRRRDDWMGGWMDPGGTLMHSDALRSFYGDLSVQLTLGLDGQLWILWLDFHMGGTRASEGVGAV